MSATLDSKLFANFFNGAPVLSVPGRTFPVNEYYLEDVIEATNAILQPTESLFSKEEFLRFVASLRTNLLVAEENKAPVSDESDNRDPLPPTPVCAENSVDAAGTHDATCTPASWVFKPRLNSSTLEGHARLYAEQVYARVQQDMEAEIDKSLSVGITFTF